MKKLLSNKWVEIGCLLALIGSAFLSIYASKIPIIGNSTQYAIFIMFGFLFIGLVFLIFDQNKLLFVSLGCCAALCVFLKNASNTRLILPELNLEPKISVAHINLSNIDNINSLIQVIDDYKPDVISLQELTPDWDQAIASILNERYPYNKRHVRMDVYGMAVYSNLKMISADTFMYNEIPNLFCKIHHGTSSINIMSSYLLALNRRSETNTKNHFATIINKINEFEDSPNIILGDFNMVYWQSEIVNFRLKAGLENSRRDYREVGFKLPMDHMFFSKHLECTKFLELNDSRSNHIGIIGVYQLISSSRKKKNDQIMVG